MGELPEPVKCNVRDGLFVEPCSSLASVTDNWMGGFYKGRAISKWELTNIETRQPSRSYFGVKSKKHPNGFLFNFCPFCGTNISAPFTHEEEDE